jgi:hypothetical protein
MSYDIGGVVALKSIWVSKISGILYLRISLDISKEV